MTIVPALDIIPLWFIFLSLCLVTCLALEAGYRFGKWRHNRAPEEKDVPVGTMVGAILGLLAFMLAFTFSLAAARFDARRHMVLLEANAISTTFLRTQLLPEAERSVSARLLREYVDIRISGLTKQQLAATIVRSEEIHGELWTHAIRGVEKSPSPLTALYVQSLNQLIDLHAERVQVGIRSRIPLSLWGGLLLLAILGMASIGYHSGLSATRRSPEMLVLILAFASVLYLIMDLDRPLEGLLLVSQQPMIDVQHLIHQNSP
ncbi:MAG: hypothetical protein R3C12_18340 [Planctomycetaceae bacterium]|nr:hypothetical protein [Planctomycetaceae bacterium]